MTVEEAEEIANKFTNTTLFTEETELLKTFLDAIEDVHILSGFNSSYFDIPYLVNRIIRVLDKNATRAFCLWNQYPREKKVMKFKKERQTYDLVGRVHLDYLELYQKHNPQQLHSYKLDFVAEHENCGSWTPYEGTLDELYNEDFEKFIEYNRQDVMLLVKIDENKKWLN